MFVRPSSFGVLLNESEHTVSFTVSGMTRILRSEPVEIELHDDEVSNQLVGLIRLQEDLRHIAHLPISCWISI